MNRVHLKRRRCSEDEEDWGAIVFQERALCVKRPGLHGRPIMFGRTHWCLSGKRTQHVLSASRQGLLPQLRLASGGGIANLLGFVLSVSCSISMSVENGDSHVHAAKKAHSRPLLQESVMSMFCPACPQTQPLMKQAL